MRIDFGSVKKYFTERGFGFVGRTFLSARQDEVFFHIRNLKRSNPDLALKLSNEESVGDIYFWYGVEQTSKGEQVSIILNKNEIKEIEIDNFNQIIIRIETIWNNISSEIPDWLNEVTFDLLGHDKLNHLCTERLRSENQKKEADEVKKAKLICFEFQDAFL